ncbi:hypothetical protein BRC98_05970 [Halobacteriales archaeon QS_7_68_65]|nr:MAG: hypothetical protein BRC98_05970 [Halobacteriales archaeon QS_7_68_65]
MERSDLGYAVLFSVPVGVGVSMGVLRMAGGGLTNPVVAGAGTVAALVLFAFVVAMLATGSPDEEREGA